MADERGASTGEPAAAEGEPAAAEGEPAAAEGEPATPEPEDRSRRAGEVQQFYGQWTRLYDLLARYAPRVGRLRADVADELDLSAGDTVIDVGCGTGANLPYLREQVGPEGTVIGVDVTEPMLQHARERAAKNGWENVHLVRADGARLPIEGPVDAVTATFVVGMFEEPAEVVERWCDLARGGRIAVANLSPSDRPIAGPLNALFHVITVLSTPPTTKLRYETSLLATLRERVVAGETVIKERGIDTHHEQRHLGYVRVSSATIPE